MNGTIKIFDCHKGNETHSYKIHKDTVTKIMFHPNPMKLILVSTGDDFAIRIYDLVVSSCLHSFLLHESNVSALLFTDNGTNLITAGADKCIVIWDFFNMAFYAQIEYDDEIFAMNFVKIIEKSKKKTEERGYLKVAGVSGLLRPSTSPPTTFDYFDKFAHENEEIANFTLHPSDKLIPTFTKNLM